MLKNNELSSYSNIQKILFFIIVSVLSITIFSIYSLNQLFPILNWILYALLIILISVYTFLFYNFKVNNMVIFLILINFFMFFSWVTNGLQSFSFTTILMSITGIIVYQFISNSKLHIDVTIIAILFGSLLFVLFFSIVYFKDIIKLDFTKRLGGIIENENDVATSLAFSLICFVWFIYYSKKYYLFLLPLYSFYLLFLTVSVSNILVTMLILFVFILLMLPKNKRKYLYISFMIFIVVGFLMLQLDYFSYYRIRIYGIINVFFDTGSHVDSSASSRFTAAIEALKLFIRKPIFGWGYDGVRENTHQFMVSHNNFTEVLANFGTFTFIFYESMLLFPIINIKKQINKKKILIFLLLSYTFIFQLFLYTYYRKIYYFIIPLAYSLVDNEKIYLSFGKKELFSLFEKTKKLLIQK